MGKPYGALTVVKTRIIRLENPYYTSGKAVSYVWKSHIIRLKRGVGASAIASSAPWTRS